MILDSRYEFADAQDISQTTGTYLSTNVVNLEVARDIGQGHQLFLHIQIDQVVAGTSSTIEFRLRSDSVAAIHDSTSTGHWTSGAIAEATLVAGYHLVIPLPIEPPAYEQYIGLQAIVGTATTSTGTYSAFLTLDPHGWKSYADASN